MRTRMHASPKIGDLTAGLNTNARCMSFFYFDSDGQDKRDGLMDMLT